MVTAVLNYDEAKSRMIEVLERDASSHERGEYRALGHDFESVAQAIPRNLPARYNKILVALSFWDGWLRAREHGWKHHSTELHEWPFIARDVANLLRADSELNFSRAHIFGLKPYRETEKWLDDYFRENPHLKDPRPSGD